MSKIPEGSAGASLNVLIQNGEVCRALRAKTLFYQTEDNVGAEGPFWCARTQSPLGPDGQVADTEQCRPGRRCCETTGAWRIA